MASSELKPAYLVTGSDRPKVRRALERLRARFDSAAIESLTGDETTGVDAVAACNALGLFGGDGRLVIVDGVDRWKAADAKAVAEYLHEPAPSTVLALVAESLKKDSPLAKACLQAGDVLVYETPRRDLRKWVAAQFAQAGGQAGENACAVLVELVGEDPLELASEVEKLTTWAAGEQIEAADVERLVAARAESPPWALTDAWGRRDTAGVLRACERALERATASALVWRLADHVALVRSCKSLAAAGLPAAEAATRLRKKEYPVRKAYAQADGFDEAELASVLVRVAELDAAIKGASRLPDELELERALVEVTRRR